MRAKLQGRLAELVSDADAIAATIRTVRGPSFVNRYTGDEVPGDEWEVFDRERCIEWMTKCMTLLGLLLPADHDLRHRLLASFRSTENATPADFLSLRARLRGIESDFDFGLLLDLRAMVEAETAGNYMAQAEELLAEGQSGRFDHVPAAVLAGAVLERALRGLCERQRPPVPTATNGKPKKLNAMIDDLKKASVYNESTAKHLRAWASTRNLAAHGEFEEFSRRDVEQMILGIKGFLSDYCA